MLNILLAGVGGQGTVLASKIIAACAIKKGENAHTAETIGMAQRGGCVVSHVRIGENTYSPLIPKGQADVIIGFEPGEAVRALPYLKSSGTVIVSTMAVTPATDSLSDGTYNGNDMIDFLKKKNIKYIAVDGEEIVNRLGSSKSLNIALLGAGAKEMGISLEDIEDVIRTSLKPQFLEGNLAALKAGALYAK
ncbi:MAG: indolepyruvate oxidoreductase subunit beta [Clostridiales bacterium]|nr:indolepyruvate oxidoreductase subunit beta [Clostridiales bacterium]